MQRSGPKVRSRVEEGGPLIGRVIPEPRRLDHAAALRCRSLLVLAGEIVFAEGKGNLGGEATVADYCACPHA